MKLKFKATSQDWLIFGLFALLLLIVVSILVNNIHSLANDGTFAGLNPFTALIQNLPAVLVFYAFAMAFLFVTVKNYFFEQEKGFGISTEPKDEKGFSRWCTDKEMKKTLSELNVTDNEYEHAGFPLVSDGERLWVDDDNSHNLVIGSTGTGKTQCIIHPLVKILAKKGESMIVTDPKGEIYRESAGLLKQKGYQIIVLNFRDPQRGNTWNPLHLPYKLYKQGNTDKAMELLDDLAANILYEESSANKDPFWEKTSADYFAGLALGLFEDAKEEEININSISVMTTVGEEKFGARSTYIKEYFNGKNPAGAAYTCASGTIFAPEDTKGSILSTFRQKIRLFSSRENLSEMLSQNDFDIDSIGKQKTAVFMIIQDEKKTYHALATIFIKQCYESLIDVAQHTEKGSLPVRTNFILDEFANMPPLKDITTMITAARSRHVRFTMIIQNFAQLDSVYGKDDAQTIRSNCNNMLYLLTTELAALKEISELCGDKMVKVGKGDKEHEEARPLATVADLQRMKQFEAIVKRIRLNPYKTRLKPNFEIDWGIPKLDADPFVERQKKSVKVFDLKEFIKNQRKDKFMNMVESAGANPPGGMMPGMSPFGGVNPFETLKNNNQMNTNTPNSNPELGFNVDDLVKKIDAKIAELEKEEKLEEEKLKKQAEDKKNEEESKKQEETINNTQPEKEHENLAEEKLKEDVLITNEKEKESQNKKTNPVAEIAPTMFAGFMNKIDTAMEEENKTSSNEKTIPVHNSEAPKINGIPHKQNITPMQKSEPVKNSEISKYRVTDDQFFDDFFDE